MVHWSRSKERVLEAVKLDGMQLGGALPVFRANREVVMAAVKQNGCALYYASDDLQRDRDVVLAAVKQNPEAWNWADAHIRWLFCAGIVKHDLEAWQLAY